MTLLLQFFFRPQISSTSFDTQKNIVQPFPKRDFHHNGGGKKGFWMNGMNF
jgi:hypothetical protein